MPRIGRTTRTLTDVKDQQADEIMAEQLTMESIGATEIEKALGSVEAVLEQRTAERAQLLARATPAPEATPVVAVPSNTKSPDMAAVIARFTVPATDATAERDRVALAEAEKAGRGLVQRADAAVTKHGILKSKYLARVAVAAATDFNTLRAATPMNLVWNEKSKTHVDVNRFPITVYENAAKSAHANLTSTFGDSQQGGDTRPANLQNAKASVEGALAVGHGLAAPRLDSGTGGTHVWAEDDHGNRFMILSPDFKTAVRHLDYWVAKAEALVAATENAVARFELAEAKLREVLERITPQPVTPPPPREPALKMGQPPAERGGTSFVDFDPRELDVEAPKDRVKVEVLPDGAGFRTKGGQR